MNETREAKLAKALEQLVAALPRCSECEEEPATVGLFGGESTEDQEATDSPLLCLACAEEYSAYVEAFTLTDRDKKMVLAASAAYAALDPLPGAGPQANTDTDASVDEAEPDRVLRYVRARCGKLNPNDRICVGARACDLERAIGMVMSERDALLHALGTANRELARRDTAPPDDWKKQHDDLLMHHALALRFRDRWGQERTKLLNASLELLEARSEYHRSKAYAEFTKVVREVEAASLASPDPSDD